MRTTTVLPDADRQAGGEDRAPPVPDQRQPESATDKGCRPASARVCDQRQLAGERMSIQPRDLAASD